MLKWNYIYKYLKCYVYWNLVQKTFLHLCNWAHLESWKTTGFQSIKYNYKNHFKYFTHICTNDNIVARWVSCTKSYSYPLKENRASYNLLTLSSYLVFTKHITAHMHRLIDTVPLCKLKAIQLLLVCTWEV